MVIIRSAAHNCNEFHVRSGIRKEKVKKKYIKCTMCTISCWKRNLSLYVSNENNFIHSFHDGQDSKDIRIVGWLAEWIKMNEFNKANGMKTKRNDFFDSNKRELVTFCIEKNKMILILMLFVLNVGMERIPKNCVSRTKLHATEHWTTTIMYKNERITNEWMKFTILVPHENEISQCSVLSCHWMVHNRPPVLGSIGIFKSFFMQHWTSKWCCYWLKQQNENDFQNYVHHFCVVWTLNTQRSAFFQRENISFWFCFIRKWKTPTKGKYRDEIAYKMKNTFNIDSIEWWWWWW